MDQAALPQRSAHRVLDRADQPRRAVADDQRRAGQATLAEDGTEAGPGIAGLVAAASRPMNTGLPSVSMPQAARTGSAPALAWYLK